MATQLRSVASQFSRRERHVHKGIFEPHGRPLRAFHMRRLSNGHGTLSRGTEGHRTQGTVLEDSLWAAAADGQYAMIAVTGAVVGAEMTDDAPVVRTLAHRRLD
jgi:hypothetical protein